MNIAIAAGAMLVISSVFIVLGLGGGILFVPILHWAGFDLQTVAIPLGLLLERHQHPARPDPLRTGTARRLEGWLADGPGCGPDRAAGRLRATAP